MKKQKLIFTEVDHAFFESEKTVYGIQNNNTMYLHKKDRKRSYTVVNKKTGKFLHECKTKNGAALWIENKTGKKVVFK